MPEGLEQEALQRALLRPTMDYSSRVPEEYAIRRALVMLHDLGEPTPERVRLGSWDPGLKGRFKPGYTTTHAVVKPYGGEPAVVVNDTVKSFRQANRGDEAALKRIAAILAHETHHVRAGKPELPAYDKQIQVLRALGAGKRDTDQIREARGYVERLGR